MKILIVDDTAQRYQKLISALNGAGVPREDVDICGSKLDAVSKLDDNEYDLLILDVLIPNRPEDAPKKENSIDILRQIHEYEALSPPKHILGLTADEGVAEEARQIFSAYAWTLVRYDQTSEEWLEVILNCVKYLSRNQASDSNAPRDSVDVAVICALPNLELKAIREIPWGWKPARPIDNFTFVEDGEIPVVNGQALRVVAASPRRMGMVATALLTANILSRLRPKIVVMTGICAGIRGKVKMGEVILADPSWDYQAGKRRSGAFDAAPDQIHVDSLVRSHVDQISSDHEALDSIARSYTGEPPAQLRIQSGPLATGSAVIAAADGSQEVVRQNREALGLEMEVYGLYAAARNCTDYRPYAFALKSVCDFADDNKDDAHQHFAAYASARVLQLLLERYGDRIMGAEV